MMRYPEWHPSSRLAEEGISQATIPEPARPLSMEQRRDRDRSLLLTDRIFAGMFRYLRFLPIESVFDGTLLDPEEPK